MKEDDENPLDDELMRPLKEIKTASESLERKIVKALKTEGLIRENAKRPAFNLWKFAAAAVFLVALFAAGFWAGQNSKNAREMATRTQVFALFLYEPVGIFQNNVDHAQEYSAWIRTIRTRGRLAGGEKLKESGRTIQINKGKLLIDQHPLRSKELPMGGYFLLQADSYEDALNIATQCPHLKYGGVIEIRQIEPT
jgi:hypothetical protein